MNGHAQGANQDTVLDNARFVHSLEQSAGARLSDALLGEFHLSTDSNQPLDPGEIQRAMEAAHTAQRALAGVDFLTRLDHSALAGGPGFIRVARRLGLSPDRIDRATREHIDARMRHRFDQAAACGKSPVDALTAEGWLQDELFILTKTQL